MKNPIKQPNTIELARAHKKTGNFVEASQLYQRISKNHPSYADAQFELGLLALSLSRPDQAINHLHNTLKTRPNHADAHIALSETLFTLGKLELATQSLNRGLRLNPLHVRGLFLQTSRLIEKGEAEKAAALLNAALAQLGGHPDKAHLLNQLGIALIKTDQHNDAIRAFEEAVQLQPTFFEALGNLGSAQHLTGQIIDAENNLRKAIQVAPTAARRSNLGAVLLARGNYIEAIVQLEQACAEAPSMVDAFYYLALALSAEAQFGRAEALYGLILERWPQEIRRMLSADDEFESLADLSPKAIARRSFVNAWLKQLKRANWSAYETNLKRCVAMIEEDLATERLPCIHPFNSLLLPVNASLQQSVARAYSKHYLNRAQTLEIPPLDRQTHHAEKRIRIGYVSADLRTHPVGFLIKDLFTHHDKERFSIHAYDLKPKPGDSIHQHIRSNIEFYTDISLLDTSSAVQKIRQDKIDILIDLTGFTASGRPEIFASHAAPIQLAYLGFPGVMCSPWLDGIISTETLIPQEHAHPGHEPVLRLPKAWFTPGRFDAYTEAPSRKDEGLPEDAFVYCCFQRTDKIEPQVFALWMRILKRTPASVLWMLAENPDTSQLLKNSADEHGVDPNRLIFAKRIDADRHLTRQQLADVFLDTLIYSGTTTLAMALDAGLPVVTCPGATFVSRLGAGIIAASDLSMPVAHSMEQYEKIAVDLAADKAQLQRLRDEIKLRGATSPLFDAQATTRDIENIYTDLMSTISLKQGKSRLQQST